MAVAEAIDLYTSRFDAFLGRRGHADPAWLTTIRRNAFARFQALGFPTTRDEDWRFLPIGPVAETPFAEAPSAPDAARALLAPFVVRQMRCTQIVFVNGRYSPALSTVGVLGKGVLATNLDAALVTDPGLVDPYFTRCAGYDAQAFVALNTAFTEDGAFIHIPANAVVPEPVHLVYLSTGSGPFVTHPRTIVVAGDNSQARIIESYGGHDGDRYLTNAVTEIVVGENANVEHYRVQRESHHAYHLSSTHVFLERSGVFAQQAFTFGGAIVRKGIYDAFMHGPEHLVELFHGYTYSAHPLACAAGLAALEVYRDEELMARARRLEPYLEAAVHSLRGEPHVIDVRNLGLAAAIELEPRPGAATMRAMEVFHHCFDRGAMVRYTGDIIALGPATIAQHTEIDRIVELVREGLRRIA